MAARIRSAHTNPRTLVISDLDRRRLERMIRDYRGNGGESRENLDTLERELNKAVTVAPQEIPADIVTMNSTVRLKVRGAGAAMTCTLVYPPRADLDEDRMSILAPLATAVLGYRVGDRIEWNLPAGTRQIVIDKLIYQPEAAGDYQL